MILSLDLAAVSPVARIGLKDFADFDKAYFSALTLTNKGLVQPSAKAIDDCGRTWPAIKANRAGFVDQARPKRLPGSEESALFGLKGSKAEEFSGRLV